MPRWGLAALAIWAAFQLLMPLRTHLYGGNVLWHDQGMRFSWRVMTREKNGSVTFIVKDTASGFERHLAPTKYLNRLQEREMAVQPDLSVQLAQQIATDFERKHGRRPAVYADAVVSLNGRAMARLIDPTVDLADVHPGFSKLAFVLPAPTEAPPALRPSELPRVATAARH